MKRVRLFLLTLFLALTALPSGAADWVLVANQKAGIAHLTKDDVTNIYLGRYRRLPSGATAEPIDQPADSQLKANFYRQLVNKDISEINAYWSRLVFSGKTRPPLVAASSEDAIQKVSGNQSALAYVEKSRVDARVMVVFEIAE